MQSYLSIIKIFLSGLISSQLISTLHVYISNIQYYRKISAIHEAGYLAVPNLHVMETLKSPGPAFFGGMFFTLTVGFFLSILSFSAAWAWDRMFSRKKILLLPILILWSGCLIGANWQGFTIMTSAHFLIIPPLIFFASLRWLPESSGQKIGVKTSIHIICIAVLAFTGVSRMNSATFSIIRDEVLFSSSTGIQLNNLYYTYTLYAAQVFKSLNQDLLKTCRFSSSQGALIPGRLKRILLSHDYLLIEKPVSLDMDIEQSENKFIFYHKNREVLEISAQDFYKNPKKTLKSFSKKCDRHEFLRFFTFISLIFVSGLSSYIILYTLCWMLSGLFIKGMAGSIITALICLISGTAVLLFWHPEKAGSFDIKDWEQALVSDTLQTRVSALKYIYRKHIDIGSFIIPSRIVKSSHIPERYWLAKALIYSRSPSNYEIIKTLLDDPQLNVAYAAFAALGARRDMQAKGEIIKRIKTSEQWYIQMYAYKTLRRLKWKQTGLK